MKPLALHLERLRARPLALPHAPALQGLLRRCQRYFRAAEGRPPHPNAALERIADALGDRRLHLWGLWSGAELVGLLELRRDEPPGEATLALLLLEPSFRRKGLGREVVEGLCRALAKKGVAALHLGVQDGQAPARHFWLALGFERVVRKQGVTHYVRPLG